MEFRPYRRKLQVLVRIARMAGPAARTDPSMPKVMEQILELLNADRGTLYLITPGTSQLTADITVGQNRVTIQLKVGEGLAGWVAMAGIPLLINNALLDDRFDGRWDKKSGYRTETVLGVPLLDSHGAVFGVLQVLNSTRGSFSEEDLNLLEAVASICTLALEPTLASVEA